ncbi:U5 snRNP complex subunit [Coprinopsis cinerea okayama7|uniref:U5 snRNP complex subunit n=1 Tax=Coprinopsis cinerea (strain Okayama-7 / 130 / ATCC MYA-4618 / FGSC 9003) TaxID=240176 RepID=A8P643_COPC7|nr:U5 snRNP complex subunit [Coprinopsis cinerea okayama7\|eukprot:XP_001839078.1 U5 snRNP complex subunit [Coprinopsis cinerea okayama7\
MSKRSLSPPPSNAGALIKKARATPPPSNQIAISSTNDERNKGLIRTVQRTSNLEAPIVSLSGAHSAEILSCRFDPSGQNIAACSSDRSISLWRTYPPNTNYGLLSSHAKAPILDLQWSLYSQLLYSISADRTLTITDVTTGQKVRRIRAHREIINSVDRTMAGGAGIELVATGSDDGTVKIWEGGDEAGKFPVATLEVGCPVTAVCWSADGASVYVGAIDNEVHVYDLRKQEQVYSLTGHTDTPTSLSLSPDGNYLLAPSLSSQTIIHDVRPFSPSATRIHRILHGAPAGFENTLLRGAWSKEDGGKRVAVGGADRMVCIWEVESSKILYKLPGHKGTVTSVDFHPKEPIILTGSKDGTMLLGEIEPSVTV